MDINSGVENLGGIAIVSQYDNEGVYSYSGRESVDEEIVSFCKDVGIFEGDVVSQNAYSPIGVVMERLGYSWDNKKGGYNSPPGLFEAIKTSIVVPPQHGTMEKVFTHTWGYRANPEYEGIDRVVYLVEVGSKRFRVVSNLLVWSGANEFVSECKKTFPMGLVPSILNWGPLDGSTLAQTTGTGPGPTAQITLDTDAAGYGWFIDDTPYLNDEFLPTSNPNEWVARPGSAAEGKMDRLTVLLHEYGHALGLDHSADAHDFMAATLQPGVRRTLSVEEQMALMALAGVFVTPDSPSAPYAPFAPMGLPLLFTRVSRSRNDTVAAALAAGQ